MFFLLTSIAIASTYTDEEMEFYATNQDALPSLNEMSGCATLMRMKAELATSAEEAYNATKDWHSLANRSCEVEPLKKWVGTLEADDPMRITMLRKLWHSRNEPTVSAWKLESCNALEAEQRPIFLDVTDNECPTNYTLVSTNYCAAEDWWWLQCNQFPK